MWSSAWRWIVGLLLCLLAGCSTPRLGGLTKSDPPAPATEERVKYGNPWSRKKPADSVAKSSTPSGTNGVPDDLAAKLAESRSAGAGSKPEIAETMKRAAAAEARGDLDGARAAYLDVIARQPQNAEAHHRLAVIADMNRDPQTADEHYSKSYAINPRNADLLSDMGYSQFLRGDHLGAERRLKEALEADQYHKAAQSNLALVYGKQGKYDDALAMFRLSGTESEAQKNMAALFPNGRPVGPSSAAIASTQPGISNPLPLAGAGQRPTAPPMPSDIDQRVTPVGASNSGLPNAAAAQFASPDGPRSSARPPLDAGAAPSLPGMNARSADTPFPDNRLAVVAHSGDVSGNSRPPLAPWEEGPNAGRTSPQVQGNGLDPSGFWQGGLNGQPLANNTPAATSSPAATNSNWGSLSTGPQSMSFPMGDASPSATQGANVTYGSASAPSTMTVSPTAPWGQRTSSQPVSPGSPSSMSPAEAARWAAQMGLGAGPGSMFPPVGGSTAVNPATAVPPSGMPSASMAAPGGTGIQWASAQMPEVPTNTGATRSNWGADWNPNVTVQGGGTVPPSQPLAPPSPWHDVPRMDVWGEGQPSAPAAAVPNVPAQVPAMQPARSNWPLVTPGATAAPLPAYNPRGATAPNGTAGNSPPAWDSRPAAAPAGTSAGATTVPNWPYAPSRP